MGDDRQAPIEEDLDRVDAALAALDAGELDEAEALTAELAGGGAGTGDSPELAGGGAGTGDSPQLA